MITSAKQQDIKSAPSNEQGIETASPPAPQLASLPSEIEHVLNEFERGPAAGAQPESWVVVMARSISKAAVDNTVQPDISVDPDDGELSFDLRLSDGRLVLADMEVDGSLDARVYDTENKPLISLRQATAEQLVAVLKGKI